MREKIDAVLNRIQIYSYRLPGELLGMRLGNKIMGFREKHTIE